VSFSRNPLTGENEVVVEAMPGRGDRFLQDGATPQRWVNGHGKWIKQPEETEIPLDLIAHVVEKTGYIAKKIKAPVDLEWVYNGEQIYWVQLRQITSSRQLKIYTNSISKDMLPGMIKPLVWSVNIPMVGNTWVRVLTELIGPNDLQADELIKAFYYRTYFEMGAFGRIFSMLGLPEETLELMMGLRQKQAHEKMFRLNRSQVRLLPRALRFIIDKARFSRKVDAFLPRMQAAYNELYLTDTSALPDKELLARIQRLIHITSETAYYNIIAPLLMQVYNGVLRQEVAGAGVDYTNLDLLEGIDKIHDYDPGGYLLKLNLIYNQLAPEDQAMVAEGRVEDIEAAAGLQKFRSEFHDFIARFGHLSDSGNDFSFIPWREQPGHLLKMIANFHQPPRTGNSLISFHQVQLPAWKRGMVKNIFSMMQRFRLYREQISSLYTFGYGLLRVYFLALGEHMVHQGILGNPNDIFYLTFPEVCSLVEKPVQDQDYAALSSQRRLDMEQCRSFSPPEIIYGDQVPPVETYRGEKLQGTPTSRGRYTGRAVVVNSLADFTRMNSGAVLVIPYSDVGWTPLFLKAGGVVSESGGMLSHSSIIAREFGIPAVVSISNATRLLDGEMVTVDGYQGEVIIHTQA
jgi:pyruvate,water dikinase